MQGYIRNTGGGRYDFETITGHVVENVRVPHNAPVNVLVFAHFHDLEIVRFVRVNA